MTWVNGDQKKIYSSIYQWLNAKQSCTNPSILSYQRVCEILEHPLKSYIMMSHHWSHARITFQPYIYCYWSLRLSRDNYIFCGIACRKWQVATKLSGLIGWLYKPGAKMSWCLFVHHSVHPFPSLLNIEIFTRIVWEHQIMFSHFPSFLNTEMSQVVTIHSRGRHKYSDNTFTFLHA